jgi:hypothetical protein
LEVRDYQKPIRLATPASLSFLIIPEFGGLVLCFLHINTRCGTCIYNDDAIMCRPIFYERNVLSYYTFVELHLAVEDNRALGEICECVALVV